MRILKKESLEEGELFISDLGEERYANLREKVANLKRYAVIRNNAVMGQLQLLEVGDDLEYLLTKYSLERGNVGRIADERGKI